MHADETNPNRVIAQFLAGHVTISGAIIVILIKKGLVTPDDIVHVVGGCRGNDAQRSTAA